MRAKLIPTALTLLLASLASGSITLPAQDLKLIPAPREIVKAEPAALFRAEITVSTMPGAEDRFAAREFVETMRSRGVRASISDSDRGWHVQFHKSDDRGVRDLLENHSLRFSSEMNDEGYALITTTRGAHIVAHSSAGFYYGLQTLKQLFVGAGDHTTLYPVALIDWPAMKWRGLHDDVSRGPVPTLEFQKKLVRTLAAYKINIYSPYFEHTLAFNSHPLVAPPFGAMSAADVRELVEFARQHHVTILPQQQTFGHLHHLLKHEIYADLAETPHGHVLAPGQRGSLELTKTLFDEIAELFPSPLIHLGADETFELGKGQTKSRVDSEGIGPVYVQYLRDIERTLRRDDKRFLFWGDIAMHHPDLVSSLPRNMIAVGWEYGSRSGFDRFLRPFRNAGMETWIAPGVNNWNRVWPNNAVALPNIQGFAREGQAAGATGMLNTTWDDNGDAIFNQNWHGVIFGAAAAWQNGESSIERFERSFGLQFHGDTTGAVDAAHRHMTAAHSALQESRAGDASSYLFFVDPYTDEGVFDLIRLRPVLSRVRIHAESALVLISHARNQKHLRELDALEAMELGARRIDWIAAKFQFADEIAASFSATTDPARTAPVTWVDLADLSGINGKLQDMRDGYVLTRELFERAWHRENRPYWLQNNLARYDTEINRWVDRINAMDRARRRFARTRQLPAASEIGIPQTLITRP